MHKSFTQESVVLRAEAAELSVRVGRCKFKYHGGRVLGALFRFRMIMDSSCLQSWSCTVARKGVSRFIPLREASYIESFHSDCPGGVSLFQIGVDALHRRIFR